MHIIYYTGIILAMLPFPNVHQLNLINHLQFKHTATSGQSGYSAQQAH